MNSFRWTLIVRFILANGELSVGWVSKEVRVQNDEIINLITRSKPIVAFVTGKFLPGAK